MIYFLDTNICIALLNNSSPSVVRKIEMAELDIIKISSVVAAELIYGAFKSKNKEFNLSRVHSFLEQFDIVPFNYRTAEVYGEIRTQLELSGNPIGWNDLMIAATAVSNDGVLVTHNTREFARVKNLQIEDWIALS